MYRWCFLCMKCTSPTQNEGSPPGSSVHGILQARILEWVAISFFKGSSNPGIEPRSPALQADCLPSEPPGKPYVSNAVSQNLWACQLFKWYYFAYIRFFVLFCFFFPRGSKQFFFVVVFFGFGTQAWNCGSDGIGIKDC